MATEVRLRDGTRALTWSLLPQDREELVQRYADLDPVSKYHRFLTAVPELTDPMLEHLVDEVDGIDHVAFVLFVFEEDDRAEPAAVGRMIRYDEDPTSADLAVTVASQYRGRGVATALLAELVAERPRGVERIVTKVAWDNPAALAMLRRLGPTVVTPDGADVLQVVVELPAVGRAASTSAEESPEMTS